MADIVGSKVLITGSAKRLGRECVLAVARAGADIILHHNTSASEADATAQEISAIGRKVWTVQADLSDPKQAQTLAHRVWEMCGGFDVLVNNASIFPASTLDTLEYENFIDNININAWAPFIIGREMKGLCDKGHIVNFLDCRITSYDWKHIGYHASKVLLELFTREMAIKFAPTIAVNAIAPGLILPPEGKDVSYLESLKHTVPMNCYGSAADVCDALLFLLGSSFITGQIIYLDGGRHLYGGYNG